MSLVFLYSDLTWFISVLSEFIFSISPEFITMLTGIISILSGFITMLLIFLNPQEKHLSHQNSGNKFLALKNKASFLEVTFQQMNIEQQTKCLKKLHSKIDGLNNNSLPIHPWGYKSAKKQIEKDKNTQYQIDKE